ncbi:MAG: restriction endonuclease [Acidobacteriota bacterium]
MDVIFKIPQESSAYPDSSAYVIEQISTIIKAAIDAGRNRIFIHTNLKRGLPLENINKVAGPFVEAWALEQFETIAELSGNEFELINVQAGKRLDPFDIVLQFKRQDNSVEYLSANVDVKATAEDIVTSGKSPNITSFARIRSEYLDDPDYIFIILSLKHRVYSEKDIVTAMTNGIMEVVSFAAYDLKYISTSDISYNPALGTGQIQIRDIHYVTVERRTTWEFLQILDGKFIRSRGKDAWLKMAKKYQWVKES